MDSNLIIHDCFSYLEPLEQLIACEFEMYCALYNDSVSGQKGWLCNMYHTLVQQLLWQDPLWYVLIIAARPDHAWRLIAYPYIAKYAVAGNSTGFEHVDVSIDAYFRYCRGENTVQAAFALDVEDEYNCTKIVLGFHKHFHSWASSLQSRSSVTTSAKSDMYTPEDQCQYGKFQPVPSPKLGARITRATIVHGSTQTASST